MHELYEIKEQLMDVLKEYKNKQKKSVDDIMVIKALASAIDHLCNIVEAAEEEEYSQRGSRYSYEGSGMGGGRNYRYSREGSYARGRGRNARRDSMGRYARAGGYSRTEGVEEMVDSIRGMMQDLPQEVQQDAQRLVQKLEEQM